MKRYFCPNFLSSDNPTHKLKPSSTPLSDLKYHNAIPTKWLSSHLLQKKSLPEALRLDQTPSQDLL